MTVTVVSSGNSNGCFFFNFIVLTVFTNNRVVSVAVNVLRMSFDRFSASRFLLSFRRHENRTVQPNKELEPVQPVQQWKFAARRES